MFSNKKACYHFFEKHALAPIPQNKFFKTIAKYVKIICGEVSLLVKLHVIDL